MHSLCVIELSANVSAARTSFGALREAAMFRLFSQLPLWASVGSQSSRPGRPAIREPWAVAAWTCGAAVIGPSSGLVCRTHAERHRTTARARVHERLPLVHIDAQRFPLRTAVKSSRSS